MEAKPLRGKMIQNKFDEFLEKISLGQTQKERVDSASSALKGFLCERYGLADCAVFLQGSYPNGTAIKPIDGGDYDVDVVCVCASSSDSAGTALDDLYATLDSHGRYSGKLTPKQPCVRIQYADDKIGSFHVDVVPVRESQSVLAPLDAPRRATGWQLTAPREYTEWCLQRGVEFRRTVQMLKRWRNEHQDVRHAIKSIVLQVLIHQHLSPSDSDGDRVAQTLISMYAALGPLDSPPEVRNPILDTENLAERWTSRSFDDFKRKLSEAAEIATAATDATDLIEQAELWQELFGSDFPSADKDGYYVELSDTSHAESPQDRGWQYALDRRYSVSVTAWSQGARRAKRVPYESDGSPLSSDRDLVFKARTQGPGDFEIWWRITNTGGHARDEDQLRGKFTQARGPNGAVSSDPSENWEKTSFTGTHLVEVALVVDHRVVAISAPFKVNIFRLGFRWRR